MILGKGINGGAKRVKVAVPPTNLSQRVDPAMIISSKERLEGESARQIVEQRLWEHLSLRMDGYKCDTAIVLNVLVKAAIEGQTIKSLCEDAGLVLASNAIREQLN
jgi:hypothetical protein